MKVIPDGLLWFFRLFVWLSEWARGLEREPAQGLVRNGEWPSVRRRHLLVQPRCQVCGIKKGLAVHHVIPVHVAPELELEVSNLWTMCERCHLLVGHLGDWQSWNGSVRFDSAVLRKRIEERPYKKELP